MNDIFTPSTAETGYVLSDYRLSRMVLSPPHWRRFNWPQTVTWRAVRFGASNLEEVPANQRGVYSFVVKPDIAGHPECSYLLYVGMVKDQFFRDRFCQYLREREAGDRSRRLHVTQMLLKWDGFLWFCYAPIDDEAAIIPAEDALLAAFLPPCNKDFPAVVRSDLKKLFAH